MIPISDHQRWTASVRASVSVINETYPYQWIALHEILLEREEEYHFHHISHHSKNTLRSCKDEHVGFKFYIRELQFLVITFIEE